MAKIWACSCHHCLVTGGFSKCAYAYCAV